MWVAIASGLLGATAPWAVRGFSHRAAALAAAVLALSATVSFLISTAYMPPKYNIRLDLFVIPPLLLAAWASFVALAKAATRARGPRRL
jgi:hypothetical protein